MANGTATALPEDWKRVLDWVFTNAALVVIPFLVVFGREKAMLWLRGIVFLLLSSEKKGLTKGRQAGKVVAPDGAALESKTIIFIRHGESDWNQIFNKNKLLLLPRLIIGLIRELLMFVTSNSVFIDSPLSSEGVAQANRLKSKIQNCEAEKEEYQREILRIMLGKGDIAKSKIVTSNLRRAINTGCIALWPRLKASKEKVTILSSLQEMSRNVDTNSVAKKRELPEMSILSSTLGKQFSPEAVLDASKSEGTKALYSRAVNRMESFCEWCFQQREPVIIVASGHSLYYKNFFAEYIPEHKYSAGKVYKVVNCGVVAFKLEKGVIKNSGKTAYRVDADSVTNVYGGFEKHKTPPPKPDILQRLLPQSCTAESDGAANKNNEADISSVWSCCTSRPE